MLGRNPFGMGAINAYGGLRGQSQHLVVVTDFGRLSAPFVMSQRSAHFCIYGPSIKIFVSLIQFFNAVTIIDSLYIYTVYTYMNTHTHTYVYCTYIYILQTAKDRGWILSHVTRHVRICDRVDEAAALATESYQSLFCLPSQRPAVGD